MDGETAAGMAGPGVKEERKMVFSIFHVNAMTARSNKTKEIYERCITLIQTYIL